MNALVRDVPAMADLLARIATLEEENRQLRAAMVEQAALPVEWKLSPKEQDLVKAILKVAPNVLHRERAMAALYGGDETSIRVLDVMMWRIRKRLAPHGIKIEGVWGHGFRLDPANLARVRSALPQMQVAA